MKRFEYIEHTADIAIRAFGDTLAEAFAAAAEGMFAVITGEAAIEPIESIEFSLDAVEREGLLVKFLSELIVIHEVENLVLADFEVDFTAMYSLRVLARGERFAFHKHGGGSHVKGVSYHMMELHDARGEGESWVQVLFDV